MGSSASTPKGSDDDKCIGNHRKLHIKKLLGTGGFGAVVKVRHSTYGTKALKIIPRRTNISGCHEGLVGFLISCESIPAATVNKNGSKYIVKYEKFCSCNNNHDWILKKLSKKFHKNDNLQSFENASYCELILLEVCNGGSLDNWLAKTDPVEINKEADGYFNQLTEGVDFLHYHRLVHGDLKPQNVLMHKTKSGTILKIADFGSAFFQDGQTHFESACTDEFKDPFCMDDTFKMLTYDIFSLACIYVLFFVSSVCDFTPHLFTNSKEKQTAIMRLLRFVKKDGLEAVTKKAYQENATFVEKMMLDPNDGRLDAFRVKEEFQFLIKWKSKQTSSFNPACPVPGKIPLFAGRSKLLSNLRTTLITSSSESSSGSPQSLVFYGIPGAGKKSIVTELCHLFVNTTRFPRGIYWFKADSKTILDLSYSGFKEEMNFQRSEDVVSWLNKNDGWLCVYENVTDYRKIQELLPSGGGSSSVLIFTSRQPKETFPLDCRKVKVDLLSLKNCTRLIKNCASLKSIPLPSDKDCQDLAATLGQLPTPIGQALSYIANQDNTVPEYLKIFHNDIKLKNIIQPLYAAILLNAKEIQKQNSIAFEWLLLCSYMYNERIPETLLDHLIAYKLNIDKSSEDCKKLKQDIIRILSSTYDHIMHYDEVSKSFSLQRVVQESMKAENKFSDILRLLVVSNILYYAVPAPKRLRSDPERSLRLQEFAPHMESLLEHISQYEKSNMNNNTSNCFKNTLLCTKPEYDYELEFRELKLLLLTKLQTYYVMLNDATKLRELVKQKVLVESFVHEDQDWAKGLELMREGKVGMKSALNKMQIISLNDHARVEQIECALSLFRQAKDALTSFATRTGRRPIEIPQCRLHMATCHSSFLHAKYWIPNKTVLRRAGKRVTQIDALTSDERSMIEFRLDETRRSYLEAIDFLVESVYIKYNTFEVLSKAFKELAVTYLWKQDFRRHEKCLLLALFVSKYSFDLYDEDEIFKTFANLRDRDFLSFEVDFNDDLVPESHPHPLIAIGSVKLLIKSYRKHKDKEEDVVVGGVPKLKLLNNFSKRLTNLVKHWKSQKEDDVLEDATIKEISNNTIIHHSPTISRNLYEVAIEHMKTAEGLKRQLNISDALKEYEISLQVFIQLYKRDTFVIAEVHERIGECHVRLEDKAKGCQSYKRAYEIYEKDIGFKQIKTSRSTYAIFLQKYAGVLPKEKAEKKVELLEKSIAIMENCFGKDHVHIGFHYEKIGRLYYEQLRKYDEAKVNLEKALKLYESKLPAGNQHTISCLEKLVSMCNKLSWMNDTGYTTRLQDETTARTENGYERSERALKSRRRRQKLHSKRGINIRSTDLLYNTN